MKFGDGNFKRTDPFKCPTRMRMQSQQLEAGGYSAMGTLDQPRDPKCMQDQIKSYGMVGPSQNPKIWFFKRFCTIFRAEKSVAVGGF